MFSAGIYSDYLFESGSLDHLYEKVGHSLLVAEASIFENSPPFSDVRRKRGHDFHNFDEVRKSSTSLLPYPLGIGKVVKPQSFPILRNLRGVSLSVAPTKVSALQLGSPEPSGSFMEPGDDEGKEEFGNWYSYLHIRFQLFFVAFCLVGVLIVYAIRLVIFLTGDQQFSEHRMRVSMVDAKPYCSHCQPELIALFKGDEVTQESQGYVIRTFLPAACKRCSRAPWFYKPTPIVVKVLTADYVKLEAYANLNVAKTRDVHGGLSHIYEAKTAPPRYQMILGHYEHIVHLQHLSTWLYHSWPGCYRWASPWDYVSGPIAPFVAESALYSRILQLRTFWTWVHDHAGMVPQLLPVNFPLRQVRRLVRPLTGARGNVSDGLEIPLFTAVDEAQTQNRPVVLPSQVELESEPHIGAPAFSPPAGEEARLIATPAGVRVGSPCLPFTMWANCGLSGLEGLENRTAPLQTWDGNTRTALAYAKACAAFKRNHLTKENVLAAYHHVLDGKDITDLINGFSKDEIETMVAQIELHVPGDDKRHASKANPKTEMVGKDGKPVRLTYDDGLYLVCINVITCKILHFLLYDRGEGLPVLSQEERDNQVENPGRKPLGALWRHSIKGVPRDAALDRLVKEFSKSITTTHCPADAEDAKDLKIEIDHTKAEVHQRAPGSLGQFYGFLHHINMIIKDLVSAKFPNRHSAKLYADEKFGITITMFFETNRGKAKVTARFKDAWLTSGWISTADANGFDAVVGAYSSFTSDPERLFSKPKGSKRMYILDGTNNFNFTSCPLDASGRTENVRLILNGEGDDGAGSTNRLFLKHLPLITANFAEIGMSAKVDAIVSGRLEYIGAHMYVEDGKTSVVYGWIPAITRYVCKLGAIAKAGNRPIDRLARSLALAGTFAGKNWAIANAFYQQACSYADEVAENAGQPVTALLGQSITVQAYSVEARLFGDGTDKFVITVAKLMSYCDLKINTVYPESDVQRRMLEISTKKPCTVEEYSKFESWSLTCRHDDDDESSFANLPQCVW